MAIELLADKRRRAILIEEAALAGRLDPTSHSVDLESFNPAAFNNEIVIDAAQAAMAAEPNNLGLSSWLTMPSGCLPLQAEQAECLGA
jgi:hypothetical protein